MTTTPNATATALVPNCPRCAGPRLVGHPAGPVFQHAFPCLFSDSEDMRLAADADGPHRGPGATFTRPSTFTERQLLAAVGADVPTNVQTNVLWMTSGVRARWWFDRHGRLVEFDPTDDTGSAA